MVNNLPLLLQGGFFTVLLGVSSIWDISKRIIPDSLCLCIAMTGFLSFEPVKLLGLLAALPFLFAALKFGGIGGGDIKLMAAVGLVLGLPKSTAAIIMGLSAVLVLHAILYIIQRLRGRSTPKAYPLAPFLSLGCIAAYFLI